MLVQLPKVSDYLILGLIGSMLILFIHTELRGRSPFKTPAPSAASEAFPNI